MTAIRPELVRAARRWHEALAGAVVAALGLWLAWRYTGALYLIGWGMGVAGAAAVFTGLQRARFRTSGDGAGVVEVDERKITYLGPYGGGVVALGTLREIGTDPSGAWLLKDEDGTHLVIPRGAAGSEALLDAFAAVPGLSTARVIEAARHPPDRYEVIWSRPRTQLH